MSSKAASQQCVDALQLLREATALEVNGEIRKDQAVAESTEEGADGKSLIVEAETIKAIIMRQRAMLDVGKAALKEKARQDAEKDAQREKTQKSENETISSLEAEVQRLQEQLKAQSLQSQEMIQQVGHRKC